MSKEQTIYWIFEIGAFMILMIEITIIALAIHILMNYLMKLEKVRNQYLTLFLSYSVRKLKDREYKNLINDMKRARPKVKEVKENE